MAKHQKFKRLFVIGDSFCDIGTLVAFSDDIFNIINQHFFIKYSLGAIKKIIIDKPYTSTSLSNGELFVSIIARKFKCEMLPAWEYHYDEINLSKIGNNYALIGARIERANFKSGLGALIFDRFSIEDQINALIKQHEVQNDDCILISIGANDLIFNHYKHDIIEKMVAKMKNNLKKLINANAKKIILFEMIDLGQTPRFKHNKQKKQLLTSLSYKFNEKIKELADFLTFEHVDLQINVYPLLNKIDYLGKKFVKYFDPISFDNNFEIDLMMMLHQGVIKSKVKNNLNDKKNSNYFYLDDIHLSNWVHRELADDIYIFLKKIFTKNV